MEHYEIVIVGGGVAGLSAALYGGWLGRKVFLAERQIFGGQIVNADQIENYPGFPEHSWRGSAVTRAYAGDEVRRQDGVRRNHEHQTAGQSLFA